MSRLNPEAPQPAVLVLSNAKAAQSHPALGNPAAAPPAQEGPPEAGPAAPPPQQAASSSFTPQPFLQNPAREADFLAIWRVIRRRIGLIGAVMAAMILVGLPFVIMTEHLYTADLRLLLRRSSTIELAAPGTPSLAVLDLSTELERLLAQSNVVQVIDNLKLAERPEFEPKARLLPWKNASGGHELDAVLTKFYESLSVRRTGQSNVVQIGFTSRDPELAALIPNELVKVYLSRREDLLQGQVKLAKDWIEERIGTERQRIVDLEAAQTAYRVKNGPLSSEFQMAAVYQISALDGRQFAIAQQRADLEARISRLEAGDAASGPAAKTGDENTLQRDLQSSKRELARLLTTYGENYPGVKDTREVIAAIESSIEAELPVLLAGTRSDIAALDAEAAAIAAQVSGLRESLSRMGVAQTELAVMEQAIEPRREMLTKLEEQLRTLTNESTLPAAEVEVLSPAAVPTGPSGHGRKFYLLLLVLASGCTAVTLACALEVMDRSIRSQQHLLDLEGTRPAGLIPHLAPQPGTRLVDQMQPGHNSAFAEGIFWLLLLLRQNGSHQLPESLLVTSSLPDEGKSTVSVALAAALQASGQPVLLVDCDLVWGAVQAQFASDPQAVLPAPGLGEFLSGQGTAQDIMHTDPQTGIAYIAHGKRGALCDWARIEELMLFAKASGRMIIFDSEPVLASGETVQLCGLAARTVFVIRWGGTTRKTVQLALNRLRVASKTPLLLAINNVDAQAHARYGFADSDMFARTLARYHQPA